MPGRAHVPERLDPELGAGARSYDAGWEGLTLLELDVKNPSFFFFPPHCLTVLFKVPSDHGCKC